MTKKLDQYNLRLQNGPSRHASAIFYLTKINIESYNIYSIPTYLVE